MKPVIFVGSALEELRSFPLSARRRAGFQLDRLQRGLEPDDWKPMAGIGRGVAEIRVRDETGAFRVLYIARLKEAVYVLHCFQKKTAKTPKSALELAWTRLREVGRNTS